jgi:hypothetical protein
MLYRVKTTGQSIARRAEPLSHAARTLKKLKRRHQKAPVTTLLDLVAAVSDSAKSETEVIATVTHLINSGKIRLVGNFQGADVRIG